MLLGMKSVKLKGAKNLIAPCSSKFECGDIDLWDNAAGTIPTATYLSDYLGRSCLKMQCQHSGHRGIRWYEVAENGITIESYGVYILKYKYASSNVGLRVVSGGSSNRWYSTQVLAKPTLTNVASWQDYESPLITAQGNWMALMIDGTWRAGVYIDDVELIKQSGYDRAYDIADAIDETYVTVSSVAYSNPGRFAFNGNLANSWNPVKPYDASAAWNFVTAKTIKRVGIYGKKYGAFQVHGSNDETNWTLLLDSPSVAKYIYSWADFTTTGSFIHYRVKFFSVGNAYLDIQDIIFA